MGRRGRPPKVKAVPRTPSEASSSVSSSPERHLFVNSVGCEQRVAGSPSLRTGMNWAAVVQGAGGLTGNSCSHTPIANISPLLVHLMSNAHHLVVE